MRARRRSTAPLGASEPTIWRAASCVVTAGPTHEPIDPVRFIGNHSSGKMGVAIAAEAGRRGADVRLVLGPGTRGAARRACAGSVPVSRRPSRCATPWSRKRRRSPTPWSWRPRWPTSARSEAADGKLKKDDGPPELALEPTPDILGELG